MKKLPSKLYHYCSVESMFNIIKSKSLWLSNSGQMNDSKESTWIEQHFEFIKKLIPENLHTHFFPKTFQMYDENKQIPYIFCLSQEKDLLSQWRAYSQDGRGVCIGFSTNYLKTPNKSPWPSSDPNITLGILPIKYNTKHQMDELELIIWDMIPVNQKEVMYWGALRIYLAMTLKNLSLTYKNPSFREEKEWRIIHTPFEDEYTKDIKSDKMLSELKYRVSNDKIVTFYEYSLEKIFNNKLIPEIILGAKSNIDIPELELFLKANGLEGTKVLRSKSTYR